MYPHFIEVHLKNEFKATINIDNINVIRTDIDEGAVLGCVDMSVVKVKESYDDVKKLIEDSGALIQMGDPRIDTRPLTWDSLTRVDMIGEPVFNSNSRHWMLLLDVASDRTWIELNNHAGGHERWIEHDAQAKPLYRMRREI